MAETSYLWDNPGTGDSPAGGYGNSTLNQVIFRMFTNGTGDQGVLKNWLNELAVTDGGVDTATVATGGAILYGVWYETDASVNVNINAYRGGNCLIVVRASWAAQTARIVARATGALTQTAGVTYEIPLANIAIDGAGAITLVTDTRDYCEYSTTIPPGSIKSDYIAADTATIAKLIDQTRWIDCAGASMRADATNPATWLAYNTNAPLYPRWEFPDAVTEEVWTTWRVPTDITSATMDVYIYPVVNDITSGDIRWTYDYWQAASGAAMATTAGATVNTIAPAEGQSHKAVLLCSPAVTAGDIFHLKIGRTGGHASDTYPDTTWLTHARASYTADS